MLVRLCAYGIWDAPYPSLRRRGDVRAVQPAWRSGKALANRVFWGDTMKRINHPRATGGQALAEYGYKWATISARLSVKHIAVQALAAMYGERAARAAIREARRVSRRTR